MSKKNVGTSKTKTGKNDAKTEAAKVCQPCKKCAPIWPVILLTVLGVAVIGASTWQWWAKGWVREKIVNEECPVREEGISQIQAKAPAAVLASGDGLVFSAPNGVRVDLPDNLPVEMGTGYEIGAYYLVNKNTGGAVNANKVVAYSATVRYYSGEAAGAILDFDIDYAAEGLENAAVNDGDAMVTVKYLGQTEGGQSILTVEGEGDEGSGYNRPFVSKLKKADLTKAKYIVKRSELWHSRFVASADGSGSVWSFKSARSADEMSAAELAATVKALKTIR
jgi:hypothetical protein